MHLKDRERSRDELQVSPGIVPEAACLCALANDSKGYKKAKPAARTAGRNPKSRQNPTCLLARLPVFVALIVLTADRPILCNNFSIISQIMESK